VMPLHDHPGMHVYGRLLFGRLAVRNYDPQENQTGDIRKARLQKAECLGPEPTTYSLGPDDGNLHEMCAGEDCAFLDIITPPYDPEQDRDCPAPSQAAEHG